ncbi:hypothetical protein LLS1_23950 [Leifsonia sp. LS1]|uniref:acyltransferase family protein n=1 Tax=Leifsonia sp. LS1 TaxID=2828483 RepID=UPI001CFD6021|nr:acyltransferase [Leifsonia sp. LS1]GIT80726.1 hypothetical protein LLS1_23950 [Leifsonia sp. LS1]
MGPLQKAEFGDAFLWTSSQEGAKKVRPRATVDPGSSIDDSRDSPSKRPPAHPPLSTRRRRAAHAAATTRSRSRAHPLALVPAPRRAVIGFRGVVILSILLFDAGIAGVGVLSVDLFLLLLCFSVTQAMLAEFHSTGTVRLIRFYLGRLKPLIPALALTAGLSLIAVLRLGTYDELERFSTQSLASLLLINNWEEIGAEAVYSETFDRISPLGHLWVVAVVEQFFRAWPLVIFAVLALGRLLTRRLARRAGPNAWQWSPITAVLVLGLAIVGVALSTVASRWSAGSAGTERSYLGTDTHLAGLLAGAAAAAVSYLVAQRRSRLTAKRRVPRSAGTLRRGRAVRSALVSLASAISLIWLVSMWGRASTYTETWLYEGGFTLTAVAGAVLVLTLTSPVNQVNRFFHFSPFVGMGNVAYTLFIVHLPIFWVVRALSPAGSAWDVLVAGVPTALLVGSALHHLVMEPLRLRRWNPQGIVVIASALVATTAALWYFPATTLTAPRGSGDVAVLALGDSLANSLAASLDFADADADADEPVHDSDAPTTPFTVTLAGARGCGLAEATERRTLSGRVDAIPSECSDWEDRWATAIQTARPDVIIVDVSRDAMAQKREGVWTDLTDAASARRYRAALDRMAGLVGGRTSVLLANARLHTGGATPPQAAAYNTVLADFAEEHPRFSVLDVQAEVCSNDACTTTTRLGEGMYTDDRVHFSDAAKRQIASWLSAETLTAYRGATNAQADR